MDAVTHINCQEVVAPAGIRRLLDFATCGLFESLIFLLYTIYIFVYADHDSASIVIKCSYLNYKQCINILICNLRKRLKQCDKRNLAKSNGMYIMKS